MLTTEQRELRRKYIGSSDAAAILGLDPWRSAADVWLEKTGKVEDDAPSEAAEIGNFVEPSLIAWAEKKMGVPLTRDQMLVAVDKLRCANLDAIAPGQFIVEGKSTSMSSDYGEAGTDQVPHRVNVQVQHQMDIAALPIAYVPVLMPIVLPHGRARLDLRMYVVPRADELAGIVRDECCRFSERFIQRDIRPDDFRPSLEVLKRVRREPNKTVDLPSDIVDRLIAAKAALKLAREDEEEAQETLLAALDDAEAGNFGGGIVTYLETSRKGYTVEPCTYRSIRIKAAKALPALT